MGGVRRCALVVSAFSAAGALAGCGTARRRRPGRGPTREPAPKRPAVRRVRPVGRPAEPALHLSSETSADRLRYVATCPSPAASSSATPPTSPGSAPRARGRWRRSGGDRRRSQLDRCSARSAGRPTGRTDELRVASELALSWPRPRSATSKRSRTRRGRRPRETRTPRARTASRLPWACLIPDPAAARRRAPTGPPFVVTFTAPTVAVVSLSRVALVAQLAERPPCKRRLRVRLRRGLSPRRWPLRAPAPAAPRPPGVRRPPSPASSPPAPRRRSHRRARGQGRGPRRRGIARRCEAAGARSHDRAMGRRSARPGITPAG